MVEFLVFLIAALLMSTCAYYLGCIHTWKKASDHLIKCAAQQLGAVDVATSRGFCANHQTIYDGQLGCPACPPRN